MLEKEVQILKEEKTWMRVQYDKEIKHMQLQYAKELAEVGPDSPHLAVMCVCVA